MGNGGIVLFLLFPAMMKYLIDTGSRVAIISLVLSIVLYAMLYNYNFSIKKTVMLFFFLFIILIIWNSILQYSLVGERLLDTIYLSDLSGREVIWENVYSIMLPNIILGIGISQYYYEVTAIFGYYQSPHNVLIEVIVYTGIVGLAIFIIFLFRIFKNAFIKQIF